MNTRKKLLKFDYQDEESENEGDFSDSASEAEIPEVSTDDESSIDSCEDEFTKVTIKKRGSCTGKSPRPGGVPKEKVPSRKKEQFTKKLLSRLAQQRLNGSDVFDDAVPTITVKDLTEQDKLLPAILNLSESDSSEDESSKPRDRKSTHPHPSTSTDNSCILHDEQPPHTNYSQISWSTESQNSEEVAKRSFEQLQRHTDMLTKVEETVKQYQASSKTSLAPQTNVQHLLALGEEDKLEETLQDVADSESEVEDWEEVKDSKPMPQSGIQLVVDFADSATKKAKQVDVEMMMRRKINRVKKEYQIYMHKVHILCWIAHGNYVSKVLNDEQVLAAALTLIPSEKSYPKGRVDTQYIINISTWYRQHMRLVPDKHENKFKPNAPPLKQTILNQIKSKVVTSTKILAYIFVCMLRALGIQARIMLNFVTLPIRPSNSELCSLSTKLKDKTKGNKTSSTKENTPKSSTKKVSPNVKKSVIPQLDGVFDDSSSIDTDDDSILVNIVQLDGNNDVEVKKRTRGSKLSLKSKETKEIASNITSDEDVSPPKRTKHSQSGDNTNREKSKNRTNNSIQAISTEVNVRNIKKENIVISPKNKTDTRGSRSRTAAKKLTESASASNSKEQTPQSSRGRKNLTSKTTKGKTVSSEFFNEPSVPVKNSDVDDSSKKQLRKRERASTNDSNTPQKPSCTYTDKPRQSAVNESKSTQKTSRLTSKYFNKKSLGLRSVKSEKDDDSMRVSHRDLLAKSPQKKAKLDVTGDLKELVKERMREAKAISGKTIIRGSRRDDPKGDKVAKGKREASSDEDFKPKRRTPGRKSIDRRVLSSEDETEPGRGRGVDVWCEVYVEEEQMWIPVDVVKPLVHCADKIYANATHPVCYVVGWDNTNSLKDLTRRYVPHWNTTTRKHRVSPAWWSDAIRPWLGTPTARDREENEQLDKIMYDAPLPKSIAEYKNHPLYALKRHLLKFEALYPPDAPPVGFVRGEAVYARACVHTCRSRDTWLKEAKTVRLGEKPYKVVKARPKWDKLSNRVISDIPLEVFGPWQVEDYQPPTAQDGVVPRNAYGNVELFKPSMLPKGTVHMKLAGLNKVARKLNVDCAPAMTGFDFHGGWTHPVFDGFVVCEEFQQTLTDAWNEEQENQERKEREKTEARVYGNWKKLIKGLLIRERLQQKYAFHNISGTKHNKSLKLFSKKKQ